MNPSLREDITSLMAIVTSTVVSAGLTAALLLREPQHETPMVQRVETIPVVVTAHDLPLGTILTAADLKVVQWPASAPTPHGYAWMPEQVIGLVVAQPMVQHEPVRASHLSPPSVSRESGALPRVPHRATDALP